MENATKALLIAGGLLIAIVILSIGITLYTLYSNQSKEYNQIILTTELQKFNSKFDVHVGRSDITVQEIVSVVNLAKEYNNSVKIEIKNKSNVSEIYTTPEQFVKEFFDSKFSCQNPVYNSETGKITKITFKEINPDTGS